MFKFVSVSLAIGWCGFRKKKLAEKIASGIKLYCIRWNIEQYYYPNYYFYYVLFTDV